MSSIHERAKGKWIEVFTDEFNLPRKLFNGNHHPCPGCGGKDKFRLVKKKADHGVVFCGSRCMGAMDFLMHVTGQDFSSVAKRVENIVGKSDEQVKREMSIAERVMDEALPLRRSKYLESRGILTIPDGLFGIRELEYWEDGETKGAYPAIIAPLTRAGKLVTVQATYLQDGAKAPVSVPKKTLPGRYETINGAAVRLGQWKPGLLLGFAEGVETALSASAMFRHPVWATLSTSGMKSVDWPKGLERAIIYADNDKSLAGHAAAWQLAHRMACDGVEVEVKFPDKVGHDWNNVLMERIQ